jgi:hypothetical protein
MLRGIQVYSAALALEDVLREAEAPLSTPKGAASIWYLKMDPTPEDIADDSGRGHDPHWVGDERPRLWRAP